MHRPVLHIMTVGTSAFGKPEPHEATRHASQAAVHKCGDKTDVGFPKGEQWSEGPCASRPCDAVRLEQIAGCLAGALNKLSPADEAGSSPPAGRDYLPAEISSLQVFYTQDARCSGEPPEQPTDRVVLLCSHTDGGWAAGQAVKAYIEDRGSRSGSHQAAFDGWISEVEPLDVPGLQSTDAESFEKAGLQNLIRMAGGQVEQWRAGDQDLRVVINPTGGYKGAIPHLVLMASVYADVEVVYKYETSSRMVRLPAMPLAFDLAMYRDHRWLLRALPHLGPGSAELLSDMPAAVRALFTVNHKDRTASGNFLFDLCGREYRRKASLALSEHGRGELLLDLVRDKQLREWLRKHVERWQHAWLGDQVPEMAEHQRGHCQRALELASQLLRPIMAQEQSSRFLSDTELACFTAAVWLHDIGHAGKTFEHSERTYVVEGFPTLIRDWHHFLTAQMLQDDIDAIEKRGPGAFFDCPECGSAPDTGFVLDLIKAVQLIARHHRRRLPLNGAQCDEKVALPGGERPKGFGEETVLVQGETVRWKLLTALYRVVDAADVQGERAGLPQYRRARAELEERNTDHMLSEADHLLGSAPCELQAWASEMAQMSKALRGHINSFRLNPLDKDGLKGSDEDLARRVWNLCGSRAAGADGPDYAFKARVLSLLSSAAFKQRQRTHLTKHAGVHAVVFRTDTNGCQHTVTPLLYVPKEDPASPPMESKCPAKRAGDALKDIREEIIPKVRELFADVGLRFHAGGPCQTDGGDEEVLLYEGTDEACGLT